MKRFTPLFVIIGMLAACIVPYVLLVNVGRPVIFPVVELPAERIWLEPLPFPFVEDGRPWVFLGQELFILNTLPSLIIADIVLLTIAAIAGGASRRRLAAYKANPDATDDDGDDYMVPKGWQNTFEAIVEAVYDLNEQIVGSKWADKVFPLVGTIFLFLLVANWLHFVPITDAVGLVHCAKHGGYPLTEVGNNAYLLQGEPGQVFPAAEQAGDCDEYKAAKKELEKKAEEGDEDAAAILAASKSIDDSGMGIIADSDVEPINWVITPFVRTATTDINLTLAFAIVAMIAVQYFGVAELGIGYFSKFLNFGALSHGAIGAIEFLVGLLESVSELLKVLSFALRLLGNIFAGTILLFVMAFLAPVLLPVPFFLFEVLIGFLQALVFAMLTMVFISVAQIGHGDHDEHHDDHHEEAHAPAAVPAAGD